MSESPPAFELDPFALPQETSGRYRMFMAAALLFVWSLGTWVIAVPDLYTLKFELTPEQTRAYEELVQGRLEGAAVGLAAPQQSLLEVMDILGPPKGSSAVAQDPQAQRLRESTVLLFFHLGRIAVSAMILFFAGIVAWLGYRFHGRRAWLRYRLRVSTSVALQGEMQHLASLANLATAPEIALKPGFLDGVAFGRKGREILALGGSEQLLKPPWSPIIQAVALHELAHIVHGDIRRREVSRHLWIASWVAVLGLLGLVSAVSLFRGELHFPLVQPTILASYWGATENLMFGELLAKIVALLGTVWWTWTELIRSRELYADARVACWGFKAPLLQRLRLPEGRRSLPQVLRRHPTQEERRRRLDQPTRLFRITPSLFLLTGLLLSLVVAQAGPLLTDLLPLVVAPSAVFFFLVGPVAILVPLGILALLTWALTALLSGAIGAQAQREALAETVLSPGTSWGYLRLVKGSLLFSLGLEVGLFLFPLRPSVFVRSPLWSSVWILGFAFLVWLWLVFLKASARHLLATEGRGPVAQRRRKLLTATSSLLLAALLWPALGARFAIEAASREEWMTVLPPSQGNPVEAFMAIFVASNLLLFCVGILLYLVALGFSVLYAAGHAVVVTPRCSQCKTPTGFRLFAGKACPSCGASLLPWATYEARS